MSTSKIVMIPNDVTSVPALGEASIYVKADKTLALRDSDNNEYVFADTRSSMAAVPRRLMTGRTRVTAGQTAGTYWFSEAATLASAGLASPLSAIFIEAEDFPTVANVTPKLKIKVQLFTNDVAPGATFTVGLYPFSRPATSGGSGVLIYQPGTVVTGSTVTFTTPGADGAFNGTSGDFALPAPGHYALGFTMTLPTLTSVATNAHVHMQYQLQVHN